MDAQKELLDAIEIVVNRKMESTAQIYTGVVTEIRGTTCIMQLNGNNRPIKVYGAMPIVGKMLPVFVPYGNMSLAFTISP